MKFYTVLAASGLAFSSTLGAQSLTGTAKWADSASREIEAANATNDLARMNNISAVLDRVLTVTPNDPLLLYYRSLALWRTSGMYLGAKKNDEAVRLMRQAADAEDSTDKAAISPGPLAPAREMLGDMLLELNRPAEALTELEAVMKKEPNRFRTLHLGARAATMSGEPTGSMAGTLLIDRYRESNL